MLKITTGYNTINSNQSFGSARKFDRQLREIMQQDRKLIDDIRKKDRALMDKIRFNKKDRDLIDNIRNQWNKLTSAKNN